MELAKAAEKVLTDRGTPMHYSEITQIAVSQGLIDPKAADPAPYVAAAMRKANRRREQRGQEPIFVNHGAGVFGLNI